MLGTFNKVFSSKLKSFGSIFLIIFFWNPFYRAGTLVQFASVPFATMTREAMGSSLILLTLASCCIINTQAVVNTSPALLLQGVKSLMDAFTPLANVELSTMYTYPNLKLQISEIVKMKTAAYDITLEHMP